MAELSLPRHGTSYELAIQSGAAHGSAGFLHFAAGEPNCLVERLVNRGKGKGRTPPLGCISQMICVSSEKEV
jgi:hypothetical protein